MLFLLVIPFEDVYKRQADARPAIHQEADTSYFHKPAPGRRADRTAAFRHRQRVYAEVGLWRPALSGVQACLLYTSGAFGRTASVRCDLLVGNIEQLFVEPTKDKTKIKRRILWQIKILLEYCYNVNF